MADLRRLKRSFYVLTGLRWLPVGAVIPFGILFMQERGLDLGDIGLAVAAYGVTVAVLELPTGGLADTLGRRPILLAAELVGDLGLLLFLFADSLPRFAIAWAVMGIGRALNSGALEAWFVDEAMRVEPGIEIHGPLSVAGVVGALALGLSAVAGGLVPKILDSGWSFGGTVISEVATPILVALALGVVHLVAVWALVREDHRTGSSNRLGAALADVGPTIKRALTLAAKQPVIRSLLLVMLAAGLALSSVEVLWQPHFADLAGGAKGRTELFGVIAAIGFAAAAVGSGLSPRLVKLLRGHPALAGLVATAGVGAALLGLASSKWILMAGTAYVVFYVFVGVIGPLQSELLHRQISSEERSTMLSTNSLSLQLGGVAGTVGIAALAAATSIAFAWVAAGAVVAPAALFYWAIHRNLRSTPQDDADRGPV